MTNPEKLTCLAIIICDDVFRDERTKKLIIVGTFHNINAREFPYRHPKMKILFTLTNGRGPYQVNLSIRDAETDDPLFAITGNAKFDNPLQIVDLDIEIHALTIPKPGKYWVQLEVDGEVLAQRPFVVSAVQPRETDEPDDA